MDEDIKISIIIFLIAPLIPIILPIGLIVERITERFDTIRRKKSEEMEEQREIEIKTKLGLGEDENYLCFSRMGGVGVIGCVDCGYQEKITSFTHGLRPVCIGRQCPNCHAFLDEYVIKKYLPFTEDDVVEDNDFVCSECGTVVRKKDEPIFDGRNNPLFCPKCHSVRLRYRMQYIT